MSGESGLFIDANLLVLYAVGTVNRNRIEQFKRTRQYTRQDYAPLMDVLARFKHWFTVTHVMAEVSNLTDLAGDERRRARDLIKETLSTLEEPAVPSAKAAAHNAYPQLGLTDAAIATVAREHNCTVLTDDLDLYIWLSRENIEVINFTHLRASMWNL